jgi:alditol oxidase
VIADGSAASAPASRRLRNWAGNVEYSASNVVRPRDAAEVCELVSSAPKARALGTRHSFNRVADTPGVLVSTELLNHVDPPDSLGRVRVGSGVTYGDLAHALAARGRALANFASLPHISVGGAVATATHGSGVANQALSSAVTAIEIVLADGSVREVSRGDPDFSGVIVSLGALGIVTSLTMETVEAFDLEQRVYEGLEWRFLDDHLREVLSAGYSVSLFTRWNRPKVEQVWVKAADPPKEHLFGAPAADAPRHPLVGGDPANCTEQLGAPGPSQDRLPHFKLECRPSAGLELQSEYIVCDDDAPAVLRELRRLSADIAPLLHVSEIRAVAPDDSWLSPFYERQSVAFHFTWVVDPRVYELLPRLERALAPWKPRPHWGKLFAQTHALSEVYPRFEAFRTLRERYDPERKFANALDDRVFGIA